MYSKLTWESVTQDKSWIRFASLRRPTGLVLDQGAQKGEDQGDTPLARATRSSRLAHGRPCAWG